MKKRFLLALLAVVATGGLASSAAASHSWGNYHWARTANPFAIAVGDNMSSAWDTYLAQATSDWSADTAGNPLNATIVPGGTTGDRCRPTRGRVEACNAAYGLNGWLGIAQIWVRRGHITQAITKANDTYYNMPNYNNPTWRAMVVCQEIGHDWGLDHQDESGADFHTCMDYADNPDADNTHPNLHDYEQLATIYGHLDANSTLGSLGSVGLAGRGGHADRTSVQRIDRISSSTIVERFADGTGRVTEIYWAI